MECVSFNIANFNFLPFLFLTYSEYVKNLVTIHYSLLTTPYIAHLQLWVFKFVALQLGEVSIKRLLKRKMWFHWIMLL